MWRRARERAARRGLWSRPRPHGRLRAVVAIGAVAGLVPTAGAELAAAVGARADRPAATAAPRQPAFTIVRQTLTLTDRSRFVHVPRRPGFPRTLVTYVRIPVISSPPTSPAPPGPARTTGPTGPTGGTVTSKASPAVPRRVRAPPAKRLPLIVFVHGYDVGPSVYDPLLDAWARAGYVVAAPVFPLESPAAPGGPTREDIVNEPADVSFVISQLLTRSSEHGHLLTGRIDRRHIAVAGHSDGGIVALGVSYDRYYRDRRIGAAVVLSGARPADGGVEFGPGSPPLLASVGTADTTNPPVNTFTYYGLAHRPKFLLELLGASHLPPFSYAQPWLAIVERVSTTFLDAYLKPRDHPIDAPRFGPLPRAASLDAQP